jgi:hypothetical protein
MNGKYTKECNGYPEMYRSPFMPVQAPYARKTATARRQDIAHQHTGRGQKNKPDKRDDIYYKI